jgi:hypothetical protein
MIKRVSLLICVYLLSSIAFADPNVPRIEPPLKGQPLRQGPPVGYVVHPTQGRLEELAALPVNAEISNIFLWTMKDKEKLIVDFTAASKWLAEIYKSGRQAYPILDTSVFHSSDHWRAQITRKAGEFMVGADGNEWGFVMPDGSRQSWSSLYSPIFRKMVFDYVDQLVDWVKLNDPNRYIPGYLDGAEWFMPATLDYSPLGISEFQQWLESRYGSLEKLNQQWGSGFSRWKDINPPRGTLLGNDYVGIRTVGFDTPVINCQWTSPKIAVDPDEEYKLSADAWQNGVAEGLCAVRLLCYDNADKLIEYNGDGQFYWTDAPDKTWSTISTPCKLPKHAKSIKMALQLLGPGEARFKNVSLKIWPLGNEVLPKNTFNSENAAGGWSLEKNKSIGDGQIAIEDGSNQPEFRLTVPQPKLPYKHSGVAWEDWVNFSYESMAGWLNRCAKHIKERDKDRQVISYIGSVFGFHSLGDFNTYWQRLDISLANSPDISINGIQMCIADRDFSYASFLVDDARKYGKTIYCTDMVDFPYGMYSGFEPIYRGVLAAVQHGMGGMFCYCWYDPLVPSYDYSTGLSKTDQLRFITDVRTAIDALKDSRLQTRIAMLHPLMSYSLADDHGRKSDLLDSAGLYSLVLEEGIIPDIWTPYEISKRTSEFRGKYDLLFVPDCPVLDSQVNRVLLDFVKNGGTVIGSGMSPQIDLAGYPLENTLSPRPTGALSASEIIKSVADAKTSTLGKGKVIWINEKLGRSYMGPARRWRVNGNTPPPFMRLDYSPDAQSLRRYLRRALNSMISQAGISLPARIDVSSGTINMGVYKPVNPAKSNDLKIFLLHTGYGRSESISLQMDPAIMAKRGQAWIDFDRSVPVEIDSSGVLKVPDFAHSSIITLNESKGR